MGQREAAAPLFLGVVALSGQPETAAGHYSSSVICQSRLSFGRQSSLSTTARASHRSEVGWKGSAAYRRSAAYNSRCPQPRLGRRAMDRAHTICRHRFPCTHLAANRR